MPIGPRRKPNIRRLKRRGNVDGLRAALRYREIFVDDDGAELDLSVEIRSQAAEALAHFNGTAVADDLTTALSDPEPSVRLAALDAISQLGIPVAVEQLAALSVAREPESPAVSERAFELLASYGLEGGAELVAERLVQPAAPPLDDRHREQLLRLVEVDARPDHASQAVAERAIEHLREPPGDETAKRVEAVLSWLGPPVAGHVLAELERDGSRPELVRAAGLLGDARAVEPIVDGLSSGDPTMRWSAAQAAGNLNHTRAVPALLRATQDDEQRVRDAASAALDRMGTAAVLAGLATLMRSEPLVLDDEAATAAFEAPARGQISEPAVSEDSAPPVGADLAEPNGEPARAPVPAPYEPRRRGGLVERLLGRLE